MEPISSQQTQIWTGLAIAVVFLLVSRLAHWCSIRFGKSATGSGEDAESTLSIIARAVLADAVFAVAYLVFGLQSALVYRLTASLWKVGRKLLFGPAMKPGLVVYHAFMNIALAYIIIEGSEAALHVYGLVVFTFFYGISAHISRARLARDEESGSLGMIRIVSVMVIAYFLILGVSEFLWTSGGMDYWIWFFILVKFLAVAGSLFSVIVLLPFLKAFMRAVHRATGPLR
ncbi:MAG: hypothetical protein GVY32_03955 [Gammaproteobacteria bacterium]|jgi:hypothetical protein|nr:hypothetical protein [Gammaproteobacteria bacterium]